MILKQKLTKMEEAKDFDPKSPFYLALKEKVDNLEKIVIK